MDIPTELENAPKMDGSPMATKRHKRRKSIHLLCVLCLFVATLFCCHPAARSVSQLSRLIWPREAATAVNKNTSPRSFTTMPQLGCEIAVAAARRKQTAANQYTVFMSATYEEGRVNCQTNVKSNYVGVACPRAERRLHPLEYPGR